MTVFKANTTHGFAKYGHQLRRAAAYNADYVLSDGLLLAVGYASWPLRPPLLHFVFEQHGGCHRDILLDARRRAQAQDRHERAWGGAAGLKRLLGRLTHRRVGAEGCFKSCRKNGEVGHSRKRNRDEEPIVLFLQSYAIIRSAIAASSSSQVLQPMSCFAAPVAKGARMESFETHIWCVCCLLLRSYPSDFAAHFMDFFNFWLLLNETEKDFKNQFFLKHKVACNAFD
jgi:hypothetical protein